MGSKLKPLVIRGARQNNLKNISLDIPTQQFVVVTGLSGSGKSSLAFETIYAEGHRRFLDSLSNYARQFLVRVERPDVDVMEGLAPTIAIEQKNPIRTSRSTVGTVTEVYDFLRLLFARAGQPICPTHKEPVLARSPAELAEFLVARFSGKRGYIAFPYAIPKPKKARTEALQKLRERGLNRVLFGDEFKSFFIPLLQSPQMKTLEEIQIEDIQGIEQLWVVVDRLGIADDRETRVRLAEAIQVATQEESKIASFVPTEGAPQLLSVQARCFHCGYQAPEIMPHLFSFNNAIGACPDCSGFGRNLKISEAKVVPQPHLSIAQGAVDPFTKPSKVVWDRRLRRFCDDHDIDIHEPYENLTEKQRKLIFEGDDGFAGVNGMFAQLEDKWFKTSSRMFLNRYQESVTCATCDGARVKAEALHVLVDDKTIHDACSMTLVQLTDWVDRLDGKASIKKRVGPVLRQLSARLRYLVDVGVGYLTCHRPARTLSGGETQRINLANQLGADLTRTFYVLDEPTVGLHPRDTQRLITIMQNLRSRGNTLFVVEHDREVIHSSDWIVDMGPAAGRHGGEVIYNGLTSEFLQSKNVGQSLTAQYLTQQKTVSVPNQRRRAHRGTIELKGCTGNNLKDVSLKVPLGRLVVVTGVSGSGKSTLIRNTLYPAVARTLQSDAAIAQPFKEVVGVEKLGDCILLDQSPIGRTPRMIPASYMKVFDGIRMLFAEQMEARRLGLAAGDFSFNVSGGRCDVCEGEGYTKVEMYFMDDLYVKCESCEGRRFKPKVLGVKVNGKSIYDVLQLNVEEAMDFFHSKLPIYEGLSALHQVGLGYLQVGQPATTLSGGEAQRLKIARELFSRQGRNILYVLDEPTTGLHFEDVRKLVELLNRLVDQGNSVVVVEHHLDVIKCADWVIDLGPGAAHEGGMIVAEGAPEDHVRNPKSVIGPFLKDYLDPSRIIEKTLPNAHIIRDS